MSKESRSARKKVIKFMITGAVLLNAAACAPYPSLRTSRKEGLGLPISVIKEINTREGSYASSIDWKETTYKLDNGNWVYVEPNGPHCFIHWEVNPEGIIVGSSVEGWGCDIWPFR